MFVLLTRLGVFGLGNIELNFDQFRKFGADRVDHRVQSVNGVTGNGLAVLFFQNGLQLVQAGFSFSEHGLDAGDQFLFFLHQISGFVSRPVFGDAFACVFEVFTRLIPLDVAVANFVRHVDDVHGIQVGDHFQVAKWDDTVLINSFQTIDGFRHALEPCQSHDDGHQ